MTLLNFFLYLFRFTFWYFVFRYTKFTVLVFSLKDFIVYFSMYFLVHFLRELFCIILRSFLFVKHFFKIFQTFFRHKKISNLMYLFLAFSLTNNT